MVKRSPNVEHKSLLEAATYREAKQMATEYQESKKVLFQHLHQSGCGSWELMKKPVEMSQFPWLASTPAGSGGQRLSPVLFGVGQSSPRRLPIVEQLVRVARLVYDLGRVVYSVMDTWKFGGCQVFFFDESWDNLWVISNCRIMNPWPVTCR